MSVTVWSTEPDSLLAPTASAQHTIASMRAYSTDTAPHRARQNRNKKTFSSLIAEMRLAFLPPTQSNSGIYR